ncbi:MAG: YCF48-related protein [Candidatus Fermentibacteria bacterium]
MTILHTTDGSTWTEQNTQVTILDPEVLSVSCAASLTAWASGGFSDGFGVVLRTIDGGTTWERVGTETELPNSVLDVDAISSENAWVSGIDCIYSTSDAGITWTEYSDPILNGYAWDGIYALNNSDIWVCGGSNTTAAGRIAHTTDGGSTWTSHADSLQEMVFRQFDQNDDDCLSPDELPDHLRDRIMRADLNADGIITHAEFREAINQFSELR